MIVVCLSGKAKSGKDTFASAVKRERGHACHLVALADPLKHFCQEVFGFSKDQLWGPSELRDVVDPRWGFPPRKPLKSLGTEWGRDLHPDVWLLLAWRKIQGIGGERSVVVVTDCRFQNELQFFADRGAVLVRIRRPGTDVGEKHPSEAEMDGIPDDTFDAVVENNKTLEAFEFEALRIVRELERGRLQ